MNQRAKYLGRRYLVQKQGRISVPRGYKGVYTPMCPTTLCRDLCKMAESIDLPFGLWTVVGRRAQVQRHLANMIDHLLLLGRIAVQRT